MITAVVVEGCTQAEAARRYRVSEGWVSKLLARYRVEGSAAFQARSRRPRSNPNVFPPETVEQVLALRSRLEGEGLDAGAQTIAWHLKQTGMTVSASTIWRMLRRHGLVELQPQKRPRSSYIRFEAVLPNETWQADFTHVALADGTDVEVLTFLDDHSRYALSVTCHRRVTGPIVREMFRQATTRHGIPASTLTDNGMVFTTRHSGGRGQNAFEHELARLGVIQKNGHPYHPQTQGKVERFQQTLKKWLAARTAPDLTGLQTLLDAFSDEYNHRRPHRALDRRTPAATYQTRPKAIPNRDGRDDRARVRTDTVDAHGRVTMNRPGFRS